MPDDDLHGSETDKVKVGIARYGPLVTMGKGVQARKLEVFKREPWARRSG
jgi:hypothetical protein